MIGYNLKEYRKGVKHGFNGFLLMIRGIRKYNPLDNHKKAKELPDFLYISRGIDHNTNEYMVIC